MKSKFKPAADQVRVYPTQHKRCATEYCEDSTGGGGFSKVVRRGHCNSHTRYPNNLTLRVQVPNNHICTQNLYYNSYYVKPKYLIIGYMDPLGNVGDIYRLAGPM